ncbi:MULTISPECIES: Cof-type HAD-IIB family hydrolase [unclassified Breznakia]|uniref:HAD family hydrolase n=1 Tax=unclassified Breznakia TaxID=2623764 RepID=UPI002404CDC3|nr:MULTISPECIES: Cof-type HAD-IIB family hydrolase [unclassified Breznakia]
MEKKYIFFDVDGTITTGVEYGNEIPEDTLQTIKDLKAKGHFLSLATGRPYFHAKMMAERVGIDNIVCNGGYSIYLKGKQIFQKGMDEVELDRLINECEDHNIPYAISVEGEDHFVTNNEALKKQVDDYEFWGVMELNPTFDGRDYKQITRMIVDDSYWNYEHNEEYNKIILMRYYAPFMIVEPDDKIGGIHEVMDYLNAPKEDIVTFGDGHNDIKMLEASPLGIAMGNAVDELKEVADYITSGSNESGIRNACKHFGWL